MEDYVRISVERYEELREKEKAIESEMIKITGNYENFYGYENIYGSYFTERTTAEQNAVYLGKDDIINGLVKDNIEKANALNEERKQHKKNKLELEDKTIKLSVLSEYYNELSESYKKHRFFRCKNVV